jgi:NTE family protein
MSSVLNMFGKKKLGLALGGGVARGIAHIGVLKVLVQSGIQIDYISGVSAGALIGAVFAAGVSIVEIEKAALGRGWGEFFKLAISRRGAVSSERILRFVHKFIADIDFYKLKIPMCIVATELISGQKVIFNQGMVAEAVRASCSIPALFAPYKIGHKVFVDGGIVGNIEVDELREMGAEKVIAVDVMPAIELKEEPRDLISVVDRSVTIAFRNLAIDARQKADLVIEPVTEQIGLLDLKHAARLIHLGETATREALPEIKKLISPISFV